MAFQNIDVIFIILKQNKPKHMKKSQLRQIIREEISNISNEEINGSRWDDPKYFDPEAYAQEKESWDSLPQSLVDEIKEKAMIIGRGKPMGDMFSKYKKWVDVSDLIYSLEDYYFQNNSQRARFIRVMKPILDDAPLR